VTTSNPVKFYIRTLFVYLCPIYVKTAEPIGPKFCLTPGKVYEPSKSWYSLFLKMRQFKDWTLSDHQLKGEIVNDKRKRIKHNFKKVGYTTSENMFCMPVINIG